MIRELNLHDESEVQSLLDIQRVAYRVEADLIGFDDIPPLKDTVRSLQECDEVFYGCYDGPKLCGVISYQRQGNVVDICRLVVHPDKFRKGIGSSLLVHVSGLECDAMRFIVSTGSNNTPAVHLYRRHGFLETGTTEISAGVFITHFQKTMDDLL